MLRSPRISSFSISGSSFIPETLPLHWHGLTDLTIDSSTSETSITNEMVLQILSRCPKLRSCKLVVYDNTTAEIPSPHPTVQLQFLHTLELYFGGVVSTILYLLDHLSLPELHTFILHGHADSQSSFSLAPFLRFWTHLESLNIDSNTFSKSTLLDSLRNLPSSLRRLSIRDPPYRGQGSELASLDDDALVVLASCCPALKTLHIDYCAAISDPALLQFITERMSGEPRTRLSRVHVRFDRQLTLDILPSLQPFIETGLDISVIYPLPRPHSTVTPFSPWSGLIDELPGLRSTYLHDYNASW
ncbi:hypothetical protein B0H19DRAFT_1112589 [Mycena capillaripes]|nr:hypothetical protein B0H19DRAFT_1112589 [Mycena capillaripes]